MDDEPRMKPNDLEQLEETVCGLTPEVWAALLFWPMAVAVGAALSGAHPIVEAIRSVWF